jgi:hypothetical protein
MSELEQLFEDIRRELNAATERFPAMNSAHEGWAVIAEELDELWEHVRCKQGMRLSHQMRKEAVQIAAMAARFALDICTGDRGNR